MLTINDLLNAKVAQNAALVVADAAQAHLIRSKDVLSGEDSNLRNTWEEICVQVQGEQTYFWEAYELAMRDAVLGAMQFLDRNVLASMWLHTDEGWDLRYDLEAAAKDGRTNQVEYVRPDIPVDTDAIANDIVIKHLLVLAETYRNSQIEEFLYPGSDDLDDPNDDLDTHTAEKHDQVTESARLHDVEYYNDTWDSSNFLVCFDKHYIFACRPTDPKPKWEFLPINSVRWDEVHQRVYRNFRADRIEKEQLPSSLPPTPTELPLDAKNPRQVPSSLIRREDFPLVANYLSTCTGHGSAAIHLLLVEDVYESTHGDGQFHYPEIAFFTLEDASTYQCMGASAHKYHIRPGVIWLDGDTIGCEVPGRMFDHYSATDVLKLVTDAIQKPGQDIEAQVIPGLG